MPEQSFTLVVYDLRAQNFVAPMPDQSFTLVVYDLSAQNLKFVAPMPEQSGTMTMHFSEGSGGPD